MNKDKLVIYCDFVILKKVGKDKKVGKVAEFLEHAW